MINPKETINNPKRPEVTDGDGRYKVPTPEAPPQDKNHAENWVELCARAAVEQDPKKLLELVSEINRLLEVRKNRLSGKIGEKQDGHDAGGPNTSATAPNTKE